MLATAHHPPPASPTSLVTPACYTRAMSAISSEPTAPPRAGWLGLSLGHLWLIVLLALIWLFLALAPLPPNDLWWHMAAGRAMLDEGRIIAENRWAFTLPADAPYVYQSWLSELAMYGLWRIGDVPALALARSLAICGGFGLMALQAARRTGSARAAALALLVAAMVSWSNWTLRPQTLALLPGAAFLFLIGEYLDGRGSPRRLIALPALMLLWVNIHGSFVLGIGLLGLALLGSALEAFLARDDAARARLWPLAAAMAATCLAAMANPLGFGIVGYVRGMLDNEALQRYFVEWQPPELSGGLAHTGPWFFAMLLLLALLIVHGPRRPTAVDVLWYAGLSLLALDGVRYAMWFALGLLPLLAVQIAALGPRRPEPPLAPAAGVALLGTIALACILTLPWFAPARLLGNERLYAAAGPHRWLLSGSTPVGAVEELRRRPTLGRAWVDGSLSSYTIWALPQMPVFADLRVELFPTAIWREFFTIDRGDPAALELLDRWDVQIVLLDANYQVDLRALLNATPGWCETYSDANSALLERCEQK